MNPDTGEVKLIDFGLAGRLEDEPLTRALVGTPRYKLASVFSLDLGFGWLVGGASAIPIICSLVSNSHG